MTSSVPKMTIYSIPAGQYGIWSDKVIKWYKCRELFHSWNDPEGDIYFSTLAVNEQGRQLLEEFIHGIENILGVEKSSVTAVSNISNVFIVKPSAFWRKQHMRMQLFTIVLRAANGYYGDKQFLTKLYSNPYIVFTRLATIKFFAGERWYKNNKRYGWCRAFRGLPCSLKDKCSCGECHIALSKDEPPSPLPLGERLSRFFRRLIGGTIGNLLD